MVVVVAGPTASGKSDLAIQLAKRLDGEIVSADSMQIYRGMDIGTAKVPECEREVPHFGIDIVDPGEAYSAALFQEYARECFTDIEDRGKTSILCGGTGFYIRAAIDDYAFPKGEQTNNPIREHYQDVLEAQGPDAVWEILRDKDPDSASIIHPNNSKRVIRALELLDEGTSYSTQKRNLENIKQLVPAAMILIKVDKEVLNERIDKRVDVMRERGLVREVEGLLNKGLRDSITSPQAIGYKEIVAALDGDISMDEAFEQIKTASRRYAKRQRSWFNSDKRYIAIDGTDGDIEKMVDDAMKIIDTHTKQEFSLGE